MRVTVMGPLKISSQVRLGQACPALSLSCAVFHPPPPTWGSDCLTASLLLFLSGFLFPLSLPSSLPNLSAQDGALHGPHWQADIQAPL